MAPACLILVLVLGAPLQQASAWPQAQLDKMIECCGKTPKQKVMSACPVGSGTFECVDRATVESLFPGYWTQNDIDAECNAQTTNTTAYTCSTVADQKNYLRAQKKLFPGYDTYFDWKISTQSQAQMDCWCDYIPWNPVEQPGYDACCGSSPKQYPRYKDPKTATAIMTTTTGTTTTETPYPWAAELEAQLEAREAKERECCDMSPMQRATLNSSSDIYTCEHVTDTCDMFSHQSWCGFYRVDYPYNEVDDWEGGLCAQVGEGGSVALKYNGIRGVASCAPGFEGLPAVVVMSMALLLLGS